MSDRGLLAAATIGVGALSVAAGYVNARYIAPEVMRRDAAREEADRRERAWREEQAARRREQERMRREAEQAAAQLDLEQQMPLLGVDATETQLAALERAVRRAQSAGLDVQTHVRAVRGERLTRSLAVAEVQAKVNPDGLRQLIEEAQQLSKFNPTKRFLTQLGDAKIRMAEVKQMQAEAVSLLQRLCTPKLSQINQRAVVDAIEAAKEVGIRNAECAALREAEHTAKVIAYMSLALLRLLEREEMDRGVASRLFHSAISSVGSLAVKSPSDLVKLLRINQEAAASLHYATLAEDQIANGQRLAVNTVGFIKMDGVTKYIIRIVVARDDGDRRTLPDVCQRLTAFETLHKAVGPALASLMPQAFPIKSPKVPRVLQSVELKNERLSLLNEYLKSVVRCAHHRARQEAGATGPFVLHAALCEFLNLPQNMQQARQDGPSTPWGAAVVGEPVGVPMGRPVEGKV